MAVSIEKYDSKKIELFLKKSKYGLIHYCPKYLSFFKNISPKSKVFYLIKQEKNGEIQAILPIAVINIVGLGSIINSFPFFGSHGGTLISNSAENQKNIIKEMLFFLMKTVVTSNTLSITIIENPFNRMDLDTLDLFEFKKADYRNGQFKNLPQGNPEFIKEELMKSFHTKTRNMVRKGNSFSPKIYEAYDQDTINWFQSLHQRSISKLNGKYKSKQVFQELFRIFIPSQSSRLYIAEVDSKPVGGLLLLLYKNTVEYFTPVIEEEYKNTQILSSIIYEAMIQLSIEGYTLWNWGGTWESQEGVYRFKDRFGSYTKPYNYFTRIIDSNLKTIEHSELLEKFEFFYVYNFNV
jgi:hypothetical protein